MIIAIDFDGVLVEDKFPAIGKPNWDIIYPVWRLKHSEHELILWTSRIDERLQEAVDWCKEHDLEFVAVNANSPNNLAQYGTDTRKIFADVYIDDRAIGYDANEVAYFLQDLCEEMEETNNE